MNIVEGFKRYMAEVKTQRELESLSQRELNDIGISRWDIKKVARDHARGLLY